MIRNLKVLGLALGAMLALGAVTASAASATSFLTTDGASVTLVGKENPPPAAINALTAFGGGETKCPEATYTGHKVLTPAETEAGAKHSAIPHGATSATVTPHYGKCLTFPSAGGQFPSTVHMNGCDYELHLGATDTSAPHTYDIKATVICPEGKHIQITQFSDVLHAARVCTVTVTHNPKGYDGLHATDLTNGKIRIHGTAIGIEVHTVPGVCAAATDKNASLHQDITVEGRNASGATTPISLSHSG